MKKLVPPLTQQDDTPPSGGEGEIYTHLYVLLRCALYAHLSS